MPWAKGQSGNPAGRPKVRDDISRIARMYGPAAIEALAEMAALKPGKCADNDASRIAAMKELLDRGYGKATQHIEGSGDAADHWALHLLAARAIAQELLTERDKTPAIEGTATDVSTDTDVDTLDLNKPALE